MSIVCIAIDRFSALCTISRKTIAIALSAVCVALGGSTSLAESALFKDKHELLLLLALRHVEQVELHIAAKHGKNSQVAREVTRRGGLIRFRADDIDYIRVSLPFKDTNAVWALASVSGVEAIDVALSGQRLGPFDRAPAPPSAPDDGVPYLADSPLLDPYRPITDLDGVELARANPNFDGRGVVIGMVEAIPDLLHPQLQRALDINGRTLPKFAGIETTSNLLSDPADPHWVHMDCSGTAKALRLVCDGHSYRTPLRGTFRVGRLSQAGLSVRMSGKERSVPVPSTSNNKPTEIPVLWDEATDTVWVDTNLDDSFADEQALRSYNVRHDVGVFGRDDPTTSQRESVGFTVTIDREASAVRINLGWHDHATTTAGAAAAAGFNFGQFDALAGKAQLFVYEPSSFRDSYNVVDAVYWAMANPTVDLVFYEWNSVLIHPYSLLDGRHAITIALDRIAARFNKLLFIPAGNNPGLNQVRESSIGRYTISVQAYDSRAALRTNLVAASPYRDNLHSVGSFGPAGNGQLEPDLAAPAAHITTASLFYAERWRIPGHVSLPHGYAIGGGTSCATPTAAAAAALLISAAKQSNVRYDGARLRQALFSTARPLAGVPVYQQGRGLIQIGKAWEALKALDQRDDWQSINVEASGSVKTVLSRYLQTPNSGVGIYEREGWRAGQKGTRVLNLLRKNGGPEPIVFEVDWRGDITDFSSASTVTLPLNATIAFPIEITTPHTGVYSGIMRLRELHGRMETLSTLNVVVAAEPLDVSTGFRFHKRLNVPRPGFESVFVEVPSGTTALQALISKESPETITLTALPPDVIGSPLAPAEVRLARGTAQLLVPLPTPGVWELFVSNRALLRDHYAPTSTAEPRPDPLIPTSLDLSIDLLRVEFAVSEGADRMRPDHHVIEIHNAGAPIETRILWGALGSQFTEARSLHWGESHSFDIFVPAGTHFIKVWLDGYSDEGADVTLLFYRIEEDKAVLRHRVRGPVARAGMIHFPDAGKWKVLVAPFRLPQGRLDYTYRQVLVHEAFGTLTVGEAEYSLKSGQRAQVQATAVVHAHPDAPRRLVGMFCFGSREAVPTNGRCTFEIIAELDRETMCGGSVRSFPTLYLSGCLSARMLPSATRDKQLIPRQ